MIQLVSPVDSGYVVSQPFGPTDVLVEDALVWPGGQGIPPGNYPHFHRAIDLCTNPVTCGGPIYAAAAGTVHFAGTIPVIWPNGQVVRQTVITLNHGGGIATIYIHEQTPLIVKVGQAVAQGQKIAAIGTVGANGCHLHFGAKSGVDFTKPAVIGDANGSWLDPAPLIGGNVNAPNGSDVAVYAPGATATLKAGAAVRNAPAVVASPSNVRRVVPAAGETWAPPWGAVGLINGGGTQWYFRLYQGQWEYVAKADVPSFVGPVTPTPLKAGLYVFQP